MKLEIRDLSQRFGPHQVLSDIDLTTQPVRSLVLIGPSGGGKSSLLRVLAGLDVPTAGAVTINDVALDFSPAQLQAHRRRVGTVFQAFNLFPHLSGLDNILLPLEKVHGLGPAEAKARAYQYLKRFQLEAHAHKRPAQLSGGQRQRIAIVRALAVQPQLLLLDEPTSALDPEMTAEVLSLIEELKAEGRDFVLVTHEISFARRVADEVVFIAEGRVQGHADTQEFFAEPPPAARAFLNKILI